MSGHEFKPGDVAMVEMPSGGERLGILLVGSVPCWHTAKSNGDMDCRSAEAVAARPVVVIDPEDRAQVERLRDLCDAALRNQAEGPPLFPSSKGERGNALQAALRSLVTPKCEAILNVKGEHIDCDRDEGHGLPHGNVEHGAIWQGVGA